MSERARRQEEDARKKLAPHGDVLRVWGHRPDFAFATGPLPYRRERYPPRVDHDAEPLKMLEQSLPAAWARRMLEEWKPR
jgi:hypothetical protein